MKEAKVSLETALLLRDKGFYDVNCRSVFVCGEIEDFPEGELYSNSDLQSEWFKINPNVEVVAPTQSLAQKWLRKVHNIHIVIDPVFGDSGNNVKGFLYSVCDNAYAKIDIELHRLELEDLTMFQFEPTYEKALESAIVNSLKRIK